MEARTCEQYVIQLLEEATSENEALREENRELADRLASLETPETRCVIEAGRRTLFDKVRIIFTDISPRDGESFRDWARRATYTPDVPDEFGSVDNFIDYFSDEYQALFAELGKAQED